MKNIILILFTIVLLNIELMSQCNHPDDLAALQAIYNALGGDNWYDNEGILAFCSPNSNGINGTHEQWNFQNPNINVSNWHGITCNAQGRVEELLLDPQRNTVLNGFIPPEVNKLTYLKKFNIKFCTPELNDYDYRMNITGTIPTTFKDLIYLEELTIAETNITGTIPDIFDDMGSLKVVAFPECRLSGQIPNYFFESLKNKAQLSVIDISVNDFTGLLPFNITELPQTFERIGFSYNYLEGTLYPELSSLNFNSSSFYSSLNIGFNNFEGCIPKDLQVFCPSVLRLDDECFRRASQALGPPGDYGAPHTFNSLDYSSRDEYCIAEIDCDPAPSPNPEETNIGGVPPFIPDRDQGNVVVASGCETSTAFDNRIKNQILINESNGAVSVSFLTGSTKDQWFPIWGDNTSGGAGYYWGSGQYPATHTYNETGIYTVCVSIENYQDIENNNSDLCNCKIICEDVEIGVTNTTTSNPSTNDDNGCGAINQYIGVYEPSSNCPEGTKLLELDEAYLAEFYFDEKCNLINNIQGSPLTEQNQTLSLESQAEGFRVQLVLSSQALLDCDFNPIDCQNCEEAWRPFAQYQVGDVVQYNGVCYYVHSLGTCLRKYPRPWLVDGNDCWKVCDF